MQILWGYSGGIDLVESCAECCGWNLIPSEVIHFGKLTKVRICTVNDRTIWI